MVLAICRLYLSPLEEEYYIKNKGKHRNSKVKIYQFFSLINKNVKSKQIMS